MKIRIKHFEDHGTIVVLVATRPDHAGRPTPIRINCDHRPFEHFLIDWRHAGSPEAVEYTPDPDGGVLTLVVEEPTELGDGGWVDDGYGLGPEWRGRPFKFPEGGV